jgi:predicted ATP-dependent serine protease
MQINGAGNIFSCRLSLKISFCSLLDFTKRTNRVRLHGDKLNRKQGWRCRTAETVTIKGEQIMSVTALKTGDNMAQSPAEKSKALDAALAQIERAFGKGSIMKLTGENAQVYVEAVSTGSLGLDIGLGIGGLPRGRITEIYGPESSGKTTLALQVIAEAQKAGGTCAIIDAEHALDPGYAKKLGVNIENLLISQPDAGEQALEIADTLVRSGAIDVLVVDSVAALVPRAPNSKARWAIQSCRACRRV